MLDTWTRAAAGLVVGVLLAVGLSPGTATALAAQTAGSPAGSSASAADSASSGSATTAAARLRADFDGDGYADLAVGAPGSTVAGARGHGHGSVTVLYGGRAGVTVRNQLWHRGIPGVKGLLSGVDDSDEEGAGEAGAFGSRVVSGDFNGDSYADLAATARANPAYDGLPSQPASVNVLYGSPRGLTATGDQLWAMSSPGVKGRASLLDFQSISAGDFDGDGRDDLVFDGQDEDERGFTTEIHVLRGSARGLTARGDVLVRRDTPGVAGGGGFGQAMTVGNFNGDSADDLVVAGYGSRREGSVSVFYGGRDGVAARRDQLWSASSRGVPGRSAAFANWGSTLAAGDFNGDGRDELAVRASVESDAGGSVLILRGTSRGLTAGGPTPVFRASTPGLPALIGRRDFGVQLSAGDSNGDGRDELALTSQWSQQPGEQPCADAADDEAGGAGVVVVLLGSPNGLTVQRSRGYGAVTIAFHEATPAPACLYSVGRQLSFVDYNGDRRADLTLLYEGDTIDSSGVAVLPGTQSGPSSIGSLWTRDRPEILGDCCFGQLDTRDRSEWS